MVNMDDLENKFEKKALDIVIKLDWKERTC